VKQPLDGLLSQQINGRRGDFILSRVFPCDGTKAFCKGYGEDLDKFKHFICFAIRKIPDIVPDICAACTQRTVILIKLFYLSIGKSKGFGQIGFIFVRIFKQIHRQDHGILICLRLDEGDSPIIAKLVHVDKLESILAISFLRKETAIPVAEKINKKGFTVSRFTHQYIGHFC